MAINKPAAPDDTNPITLLTQLVKSAVSGFVSVYLKVPLLLSFLVSLFFLVVIVIVGILLYLLVFYARPVIPGLSHSSDFDAYMADNYYPDFVTTLKIFSRDCARYAGPTLRGDSCIMPTRTSRFSVAWSSSLEVASSASNSASILLRNDDQTLQKALKTYFTHFRCFASRNDIPYSFFCGSALSHNPDFCDVARGGRVLNMDKVTQFETDFVSHIEIIRNACKSISTSADDLTDLTNSDWYRSDSPRAFEWVMSAHKLRMYLNEYHLQINESAMSRVTDKFAMNTWILFYIPFVNDILRYRIPEVWRKVPSRALRLMDVWKKGWTRLGNFIVNIPCYMVFTGEKRAKYCTMKLFK